jgi:hypothetical protein
MRALTEVENFGGTDADNILLQAFEDHEAYLDVMALRRHVIIGKKGSGKTAIFEKIITTRAQFLLVCEQAEACAIGPDNASRSGDPRYLGNGASEAPPPSRPFGFLRCSRLALMFHIRHFSLLGRLIAGLPLRIEADFIISNPATLPQMPFLEK